MTHGIEMGEIIYIFYYKPYQMTFGKTHGKIKK